MRTCKASGCYVQTRGYSSYCERHKRTLARHGHPHQVGITKANLKPYIKEIHAFLERGNKIQAQAVIQDIWDRTVQTSQKFTDQVNQGRAHVIYEMQAHEAILSLSKEQYAETIGTLLMALGFWYQDDPRFWRYDDGFRFQVVRLLLRLNPREASYQWRNGKMERCAYREVPPRTIRALWGIVSETGFVGHGVEIAKRKVKAIDAKRLRAEQERDTLLGPDDTKALA